MSSASNGRANFYTDSRDNLKNRYLEFEEGSAVRQLEEVPSPQRRERKKAVARARSRATAIGRGYVVFLAVVCALSLFLCVTYLQQKARMTTLYEEIAVLESQYTKLKSDNDAKYNQVIGSVTLEDVKNSATERLGMHYAEADQIQYYTLGEDSYVRQYKEVTDAG